MTCPPAIWSESVLAVAGILLQAANATTEIAGVKSLVPVIIGFLLGLPVLVVLESNRRIWTQSRAINDLVKVT